MICVIMAVIVVMLAYTILSAAGLAVEIGVVVLAVAVGPVVLSAAVEVLGLVVTEGAVILVEVVVL